MAVLQAMELERAQEELRGIALGNAPAGTPSAAPLNMLAHALARFIIRRLLTTRAAVRAATALSLRLLPLATSPDGSTPAPYPEAALRTYLRNSPTMSDLFPVHPTFLALPPSPLSLPLCSALLRHGMGRISFKTNEPTPRVRWQRMHFFLAIGLDPNGLAEGSMQPPSQPPPPTGASPSPLSTHQRSTTAEVQHAGGQHSALVSTAAPADALQGRPPSGGRACVQPWPAALLEQTAECVRSRT